MRDVGTRGIVGITLNHALFVRQKKHKKNVQLDHFSSPYVTLST